MANEFNSTHGSRVPRKDAMAWIEKYDSQMRKDKATDTKSVFFGRETLLKILSEDKCAGISFFLGVAYNENFKKDVVNVVLVGTTEEGDLLWGDDASPLSNGGGAGTFDFGLPCPPYCPK